MQELNFPQIKIGQKGPVSVSETSTSLIKKGIWIYFLLLIFEGALRKWILPGLATPLLIVRDPVALFIILAAARQGLFPLNIYSGALIAIGFIAMFTALFLGHGNFFVALYGARIFILHLPLIFVMGRLFNRRDVINIGLLMMILAPFMSILLVLQFYSPQSAWVNRGVGGNLEGAGFGGALGYFRPPGTFSFTSGTVLFYGLLAPYMFYFWFHAREIPRWILIAASIALLAAIPLSISRTLFFSVLVSLVFVIVATVRQPRYFSKIIFFIGALVLILFILSFTSFFQTAIEAFSHRFEDANRTEGGVKGVLGDRYLGGMLTALTNDGAQTPFWGYGLGVGTNVGSMLLTGKIKFLVGEQEWERLIGEMGILLGLLTIILRLAFTGNLFFYCYKRIFKRDLLPWFLLSFAALQLPQGQWAQPTSLGFCVLAAGLVLAALRSEEAIETN